MNNRSELVNRQTYRTPMVRKPSKFDTILAGAFVFMRKLGLQLTKTLLATAFAALADYIRKKADPEASTMLGKHGGFSEGNPQQRSENQKNLYGQNYPAQDSKPYDDYYNSGYNRRQYGHESFPGF